MSERLKGMLTGYLQQAGANGMAKLSIESCVSLRTLYQIKNDNHVPSAEIVYRVARACGLSKSDALRLANERILDEAKGAAS